MAAVAPVGGDRFSWSDEYRATAHEAELARLLQLASTVVTIFFMALQL